MTLSEYTQTIARRFKSGISREHSYRGDLENLICRLVHGVEITNEPANVTDCGNPDYVITRRKIPVGYIEAKDIGKDLNHKQYREQFSRYRKALDNLIVTDYTWFQFFQNGELVHEIRIAEVTEHGIRPLQENFEPFIDLIRDFCAFKGQTIKSPKKLAEMMAAKARLLQTILENAVTSDVTNQANSSLRDQYNSFKKILIHDLEPSGFADIYAQTLAYGMFAARLHDSSLDDFSRQEAAELIPRTNPFLRRLFGYIAGPDIDDRIRPTVDNLADVFRATNIEQLLKNFGRSIKNSDPIIHFYETFLAEYDPMLRKARGVWYTPEPVVSFIIRAVDELLKTEFGLKDGLADISKTKIKVLAQGATTKSGKAIYEEREVHKIQILDPAAGTGTFLAEVIKFIYNGKFQAIQGAWSGYVEEHLIPRLNGFELLMASYAMAHLKLDMLLAETGYQARKDQRFNIYLTNSLEEHHPDTGTLFASWLSSEANEANHIKRDTPVMVVLGNPPYSGESANKGDWIMKLMEDYKKEPGGKEKLKERNPKWINDDYVKFIRYGQHFIEKNGGGILAFITPHGFLDNPTFRGMRWNLLKTYDKIYTLDLHGNSKKKETCPDGSPDINIFDIEQGVSISLFLKTGKKKPSTLATVYHCDLYGKRQDKYDFLTNNSISSIDYTELPNIGPAYFMAQKDFDKEAEYNRGFELKSLFLIDSMGITSGNDQELVAFAKNEFLDIRDSDLITPICYRPFDTRLIYYDPGRLARARFKFMKNLAQENYAISLIRRSRSGTFGGCLVLNGITDKCISSALDNANIFPLYLYPDTEQLELEECQTRKANLAPGMVTQIAEALGLEFTNEKDKRNGTFAPIDLLDYIYAILYSPTYHKEFREFLAIDFPRIPWPSDIKKFWQLVRLGAALRQIHLLESPAVENLITSYPIDGDNSVSRMMTSKSFGYEATSETTGRVWINSEQYFDGVPLIAWDLFIGAYQPARKWLKDRHGRTLSFEEIIHYQKIIVALLETSRLMRDIDCICLDNRT